MSKWHGCPITKCINDICNKQCIELKAREIYLGRHEDGGGRWELVETKDIWRKLATEAILSNPPPRDDTGR